MSRAARFSVSFLRNVLYYTAVQGHELGDLCRASGIEVALLQQPDAFVEGPVVERVWQVCLEQSGDEDLGLHIGEAVHPSVLGLLGFAMLSCGTVGAALEKLARYWNLMSDATEIRLGRTGNVGGVDIAVLEMVVLDLPGNFLRWNRHPVESSLGAALTIVKGLAGNPLGLREVASTFGAPARTGEYLRIFGRMPRFGAECARLEFGAEALEWPVLQANAGMLEALEGQIRSRLAVEEETAVGRVRHALAKGLRGEVPGLAEVARALHQSERALQRDLQREGATFRGVLDELRAELAQRYLRDPAHSIADVSFLLGFSEPSVFHRSFRKWMGVTPQGFRQSV
jgi:AraC-like DNA-binding protein